MKTLGKIILGLIALAGLIAATFYLFIWRPSMTYWNEHKGEVVRLAEEFVTCVLNESDSKMCREKYMTEETKRNVTPEKFELIANHFRSKLGKRHGATLDESSDFEFKKDSRGLLLKFKMIGNYDQDPKVRELYTIIRNPDGSLIVQDMDLNSDALLK